MSAKSPRFQLPSEWNDEDRMYYLLAPFPTDIIDPLLTDSKLMFWKSLIITSSRELGECVFTKRQLCERFKWQEMQPKCLTIVIQAMERLGDIKKFASYQERSGWIGWGVSIVTSPVTWAWNKYMSSNEEEEEYILLGQVKELAESVFTAHMKEVNHVATGCLMLYSDFIHKCSIVQGHNTTPLTYRAIELELLRTGLAVKRESKDNQVTVIKFARSTNERVIEINEIDYGIISIKNTIEKLKIQISNKIENREKLKQKCIEYNKNKHKSQALHYLRLSKSIDSHVVRLEKHLENLQEIINQIEMAETNTEVFNAYQKGSSALKKLREDQGLTLEKVEDVMDEVQQLLEEGDEMSNVLSKSIDGSIVNDDDDELLKELDLILYDSNNTATVDITKGLDELSLDKDSNTAATVDITKGLDELSFDKDSNTAVKIDSIHEDHSVKQTKPQRPVVLLS